MTDWALSLAAAASLIYLLRFAVQGPSLAKSVIKTLSVALLAYVAWAQHLPPLLTLGLMLGALGDAFLSREGDRAFLAGLASFALSHLAYVALFVAHPGADLAALTDPAFLPFTAAIVALVLGMGWRLWPVTGDLRAPVMVYVAIIAAMGLSALALGPPVLWAALLFIVSDTILATELFLMKPGNRWRKLASRLVWVTYWGAQVLFLLSFLALDALQGKS
ncbi:lysoplasmalogenase [Tropicibacter oceani]|uniref:Lysoplasmalogenase n=1 Tax=Tropicibacter oceani TaxID=3058420 RepID=A0ABY8QDC8_9RHOB|nr:lysoplasmalogenase [Tropicibacter oceani]WGW02207.1 lysoplasmalogenase [Tropicibacter oceani]